MLSCDVEEIQQKIKGAIDRNDFKSVRHMLDKYRCNLPFSTVMELTDYVTQKEKEHKKMAKRRQKQKKRNTFHSLCGCAHWIKKWAH